MAKEILIKKGPEVDNKNFIRKKEQKMADKDLRPKPSPSLRDMKKKKGGLDPSDIPRKPTPQKLIDPKTKRIKIKDIEPDFTIKNTGSTEGMRDAAKIEGKPHSSPEGRFMSKIRSMPLKVVTFKNGGSVRLARKGGGRAYGKNS
jgi:hypothetical protein